MADKTTDTDAIARDLEALRADIAELGKGLGDRTASRFRSARNTTQDELEGLVDELAARLSDVEHRSLATVRENPIASLAIAAAVGCVAALLIRR